MASWLAEKRLTEAAIAKLKKIAVGNIRFNGSAKAESSGRRALEGEKIALLKTGQAQSKRKPVSGAVWGCRFDFGSLVSVRNWAAIKRQGNRMSKPIKTLAARAITDPNTPARN